MLTDKIVSRQAPTAVIAQPLQDRTPGSPAEGWHAATAVRAGLLGHVAGDREITARKWITLSGDSSTNLDAAIAAMQRRTSSDPARGAALIAQGEGYLTAYELQSRGHAVPLPNPFSPYGDPIVKLRTWEPYKPGAFGERTLALHDPRALAVVHGSTVIRPGE